MEPITGPFTRFSFLNGPPNQYGFKPVHWSRDELWYRQKRPYDRPLGYSMTNKQVLAHWSWEQVTYTDVDVHCIPFDGNTASLATNKAYRKFLDKFSEKSEWAVTLIQQKQTISLLADPLSKLLKFTKLVKRGKFKAAANVLGTQVPKGLKNTAKAFGNNWLKYHFGIEPLVKDIHASIKTLESDFDLIKVEGAGSESSSKVELVNLLYGIPGGTQELRGGKTTTVETRVVMRAYIRIDNPNLFLASQMGLVNPATILWELIPFSFIVDWFANVGQILNSMSDFAGTSMVFPSTSTLQTRQLSESYVYTNTLYDWHYPPVGDPVRLKDVKTYPQGRATRAVSFTRGLAIAGPTLRIPIFKGLSVSRGASAVALLLQSMK